MPIKIKCSVCGGEIYQDSDGQWCHYRRVRKAHEAIPVWPNGESIPSGELSKKLDEFDEEY
jgi:hypothetical protein